MGIGSAFIAAFKADFAGGDVELFMKSTMAFLVVASLVYSRFLVLLPPKMTDVYSPNEIKWGNLSIALWYIVSFGFAIYLVALAMVQTIYDFDQNIRYILFGVAVFLWFLPTLLALLCHGDVSMKYEGYKSSSVEGAPSVNDWSSSVNSIEPVVPKKRSTHKNSDVGMPDIFRYVEAAAISAAALSESLFIFIIFQSLNHRNRIPFQVLAVVRDLCSMHLDMRCSHYVHGQHAADYRICII